MEPRTARRVWAQGQGGERLSPQGALYVVGGVVTGLEPMEMLLVCGGGCPGEVQVDDGVCPRAYIRRNCGEDHLFCPLFYP